MCIEIGLFDKLVQLMLHDDPDIKKEVIWAISNSTAACDGELMNAMVQKQLIEALGVALKFKEPRIIFVSLEGLTNCLKFGS